MANAASHAALPFVVKGARFSMIVPYLDADGDPTDPTTPDTEVSKDAAAFADCTEEVTTVTGGNGIGYITLTGDETNCSLLAVAAKVASGPKNTLLAVAPRVLAVVQSGTAQAGAAGTITLASGASAEDDFYNGCIVRTTGGTGGGGGSGSLNNQARVITDYAGSTKVATISPNWETNPDGTTTYEVLLTEMANSLLALHPTVANRTLDVASTGEAGVDFSNVNGTLDAAEIGTGAITAAKFASGAIDATAIASGAITSAKFAAGAIDAAAIAAGAVDADALATDAVTEIRSLVSGTSDSGTTTTMVDAARTEADTDYWKGCFILFTSGTISGQCRLITGFTPGTDTITFAPSTTQAVGTQTYEILPSGRGDVHLWLGSVLNALISGRPDVNVGAMQAGVVTASAVATDAIDADAIASDAVTEIQSGLATSAALATVQADTDNIQTRLPAALVGGRMDSDVGAMQAGVVTAAAIASNAIDADALAADATTELRAIVSGTADSGTTTTMVDAARTEADTDYWKDMAILFTSGTISGQARLITAFNPATDTITFSPAVTQAVGTNTYEIIPNVAAAGASAPTAAEVADAVWDEDATAHQTQGSFGQAIGDPVADSNTIYKAVVTDATGATVGVDVVAVQADTDDLQARTPAALVGGRMDASVGAYQTGLTPLQPTVAGRTLDVTATGEAGIDWANIGSPTTAQNLSATNIDVDQVVASVSGAVGSVTGNVSGNVVGSVGSVATGGIAAASFVAGAIDAAAIAANAIGASELAADAVTEIQSGLATAAALATVQADTDDIQTRLPAALVSGRIDASVGAVAANAITAASIATGAIDADALAADAVTEIWAKAMSDLSAVPGITASVLDAINWMFELARNRVTQTATVTTVYKDDGSTALSTSTVSDNGTTFDRGEFA